MNTALKNLAGDRLAGYLVRYGSPVQRNAHGEWFSRYTNFGRFTGRLDANYDHVQTGVLARVCVIDRAVERPDGIYVEAQLDTRNRYVRAIQHLAQLGVLGMSSEARSECVEDGDDGLIVCWPIVRASITPTPAEYRMIPLRRWLPRVKAAGVSSELETWIQAQLDVHQEYLEAVEELYDADKAVERAASHHTRCMKLFGSDVPVSAAALAAAERQAQFARVKYAALFKLGLSPKEYKAWQRTNRK